MRSSPILIMKNEGHIWNADTRDPRNLAEELTTDQDAPDVRVYAHAQRE